MVLANLSALALGLESAADVPLLKAWFNGGGSYHIWKTQVIYTINLMDNIAQCKIRQQRSSLAAVLQ